MDHFIKFHENLSLDQLNKTLQQNNSDILLLRFSKLTGTVKIRAAESLKKRDIKRAFRPHKIEHIYDDFPVKIT
jgi:hypothetical protein